MEQSVENSRFPSASSGQALTGGFQADSEWQGFLGGRRIRITGLKPAFSLAALRGAEAPLFHGSACICELLQVCPYRSTQDQSQKQRAEAAL